MDSLFELIGDRERRLREGVLRGVVRGVVRADMVPAGRESSCTIRSFSLSSGTAKRTKEERRHMNDQHGGDQVASQNERCVPILGVFF